MPVLCVLGCWTFGSQTIGMSQPHTTKPAGVILLRSDLGTKGRDEGRGGREGESERRREGGRDNREKENALVQMVLA